MYLYLFNLFQALFCFAFLSFDLLQHVLHVFCNSGEFVLEVQVELGKPRRNRG